MGENTRESMDEILDRRDTMNDDMSGICCVLGGEGETGGEAGDEAGGEAGGDDMLLVEIRSYSKLKSCIVPSSGGAASPTIICVGAVF